MSKVNNIKNFQFLILIICYINVKGGKKYFKKVVDKGNKVCYSIKVADATQSFEP